MSPHPDTRHEHPAVTGIACRLPGGVTSPRGFWELLAADRDAVAPIPEHRWKPMVALLAEQDRPETPWHGGVLDDIDAFDRAFFGIAAEEAAALDPQQRLLLEVAVEALADAGSPLSSVAGSRTGVYVGCASIDQQSLAFGAGQRPGMLEAGGAGASMLAARVAHHLDLRGPALAIDTACSSSLVALDYARRDLQAGVVERAIVAGTNLIRNPRVTTAFQQGGVLSPTGHCRPFDAEADGYVRAEAIAAIVLTPARMLRPGIDRVYARLAGSHVNTDGKSPGGVFAPSHLAQTALLRDAYTGAGISMDEVGYVEAHGTGTKAGDRVEAHALASAFAREENAPLPVGSVKSQLGHTEGAAGLVGLIKAALVAYHRRIPPTLHHTRLRPALAESAIRVPTAPEALDGDVVGVSSFGFGGVNAHAILMPDSVAPPTTEEETGTAAADRGPVVVPVSGHTPALMAAAARRLADTLGDQADLAAVAALAAVGRDHHPHRAAVIASDTGRARRALRALAQHRPDPALIGPHHADDPPRQVVWVLPGQAAPEEAPGAELAAALPGFAEAAAQVQQAMAAHPAHQPWQPGQTPGGLAQIQQATVTLQIALGRALCGLGLEPDVIVGHSLGEVAAAHLADAFSLNDAAWLACARSAVLQRVAGQGHLLAAALDADKARTLLRGAGRVWVAADNGPGHTLLTGASADLESFQSVLEEAGIWTRQVPGSPPAHSPLLDAHLDGLAADLARLTPREAGVAMVSTATGIPVTGADLDAAYWVHQVRHPVDLPTALHTALGEGAEPALVVEVGTRPVLAGALEAVTAAHPAPVSVAAPGERHMGGEHARLLALLGAAYTRGHPPAWPVGRCRPAELPPLLWDHTPSPPDRVPDLAESLAHAAPEWRLDLLAAAIQDALSDLGDLSSQTGGDEARTDVALLGINSRDLAVAALRLRRMHPALEGVDLLGLLLRRPSADQIAGALLPLIEPASAPPPA
ncbi:type I polyketide synthase [Streptomonospora arabica]|uniref:Type I polyketide synthase n=1 Tax=Streptomonospora arabica TaxID=412417 RepID=A0ABV9SKE5_9ACTN